MTHSGRVIEEQKNYFIVDVTSGTVIATASGSLRKQKMRVCTGDIVDLQIIDDTPPRGVITRIQSRSTFIRRPALANCSHLFCVTTLKEPPLNVEMLDRLLFSALAHGLVPCIIINKTDIFSAEEQDECEKVIDVYRRIGITTLTASAYTQAGIAPIIDMCRDRIAAFAGLSGVGKSSLLSCIFPKKEFRIGDLSAAATRGTHTTTNITLLSLDNGGYIADTPGIAFVNIPEIPADDVIHYFSEIAECTGKCRFNNCRHRNEPGCLVRERVENGLIAPWRHRHYLRFFDEMRTAEKKYH